MAAAVVLAAVAAVLSAINGLNGVALVRLIAVAAALVVAMYLILGERRRHEQIEVKLSAQASSLETLVESMATIAASLDEGQVLERVRSEAERLFGGRAAVLGRDAETSVEPGSATLTVPLRARDQQIAALRLERDQPFERTDVVRATVLADFAARSCENARLFAEAQVREAERSRLSDQLITAEQEERRRLANELHDGAVQSMAGIALMLDAAIDSIENGRTKEGTSVIENALGRQRETIRSLRDLSFNLEPVVLRDQGFSSAVHALAEGLALQNEIRVDVDVGAATQLGSKTQTALYQIIREALNQAVRRGPPSTISLRVASTEAGGIETVITDDAPGERRQRAFEAIAERARTLNGQLTVEQGRDDGTVVRIVLPPYVAAG